MPSIHTHTPVIVGLSGGIDSAVSAWLLAKQGFRVIGATLKLWEFCASGARRRNLCCSDEGIAAARAVCEKIGCEHIVADASEHFFSEIVQNFLDEYSHGRTPNPCILCNPQIKWAHLLSLANEMGIEKVATGHYARTLDSALSGKNLLRGADAAKDQSYFLYRLDVSAFGRTIFPIGHLVKQQVRAIARNADLPVSSPRESQELCFLPNGGLENICREFINQATVPGPIFDKAGKKRGMHNGIALYTIGQRSGFGGGFEQPMYVIGIRANQNAIVIGTEDDLLATTFIVSNLAWIRNPQSEFSCTVRIRHRHRDAEALIKLIGSNAQIVFEKPQRAITPGQSAVFYDGPAVIGGGIIESVNTL